MLMEFQCLSGHKWQMEAEPGMVVKNCPRCDDKVWCGHEVLTTVPRPLTGTPCQKCGEGKMGRAKFKATGEIRLKKYNQMAQTANYICIPRYTEECLEYTCSVCGYTQEGPCADEDNKKGETNGADTEK